MAWVPFKVDCVQDLFKYVCTPKACVEEFADFRSEV